MMDQNGARELLQAVADGRTSVEQALLKFRQAPFEDMGFAKPDYHRALRQGMGEVIYGAGKTTEQIRQIAGAMLARGQRPVLITRMDAAAAVEVEKTLPLRYDALSRIGVIGDMPEPDGAGVITVVTGGTSDMPVAEEAALTAEAFGNRVERIYDVGVAGLHRLLGHTDAIMTARAVIAVAGMEGALASVVGGLAGCPVIAVPTSVGYGASFGGLSALLAMLNSCAVGVSVVNIDNGFGAACIASMINHI